MVKKDLLLISGIPTGMLDFFLKGEETYSGMPAFKEVFLSILNDERVGKIHLNLFVDASQKNKINIPQAYKTKVVIKEYFYDRSFPITSIISILRIIFGGIILGFSKKISGVMGFVSHGAFAAGIIGFITNCRNVRRIYGTFLINEMHKSRFRMLIDHPFEYLSLNIPGGVCFITNDGTKGDLVFKKFGSSKVNFKFLLNGIDPNISSKSEKPPFELPPKFLAYVARIDNWKSQHLLIEALILLDSEGIDFPITYIIGPVTDPQYYKNLLMTIEKNELSNKVKVITGLPSNQGHYFMANAYMTFSLYHTSNLGNVFLETLAQGGVMVAINDTNSLSFFPNSTYYEIRNIDVIEIAAGIKELLNNEILRNNISKNAKEFSKLNLASWSDRSAIEVNSLLD